MSDQNLVDAIRNLYSICDLVMCPLRYGTPESFSVRETSLALGPRCRRLHVLSPLPNLARDLAEDIISAHRAALVRINLLMLQTTERPTTTFLPETFWFREVRTVRIDTRSKFSTPPPLCVACDDMVLMYHRNADPKLSIIHSGEELKAITGALDLLWSIAKSPADGSLPGPPPHLAGLLEQFAAGVTDRAAQRTLNISGRTLSRRAAELLRLLNSRNRFQAGAEAVRRKWI